MIQERPLSRLPAYVAAARARNRPTRLVLRNTEQFGLVHMYFQEGHLVAVEGYRGAGRPSIAAVATWANGTIRQDDLTVERLHAEPDPALDHDLDILLSTIQARFSTVGPPSPSSSSLSVVPINAATLPLSGASMNSLPSLPSLDAIPDPWPAPSTPPSLGPGAGTARTTPAWHTSTPSTPGAPGTRNVPAPSDSAPTMRIPQAGVAVDPALLPLSPPQWQTVTLALHQIVDRAGMAVGAPVAAGLLVQTLHQLAPRAPFLAELRVDDAAWLQLDPIVLARTPAYLVATAIAELMMAYEERCIALVGEEGARRIIVEAVAPMRQALTKVGLDIATN